MEIPSSYRSIASRGVFAALLFQFVSWSFASAAEPVAQGQTPAGHSFTIYADGSAGVDAGATRWSISCQPDKMTDELQCSLTGGDNYDFFIDFGSGEAPIHICALGHDFPGRNGAVRFDSGKAIDTDENGCIPGTYITSMAKANTARTRYVKWPNDWNVDNETSLSGLVDALSILQKIRSHIFGQ